MDHKLILDAGYDPEDLSIIFHAFDGAWSELKDQFGSDPASQESGRIKLAQLILMITRDLESLDAALIQKKAVTMMANDG